LLADAKMRPGTLEAWRLAHTFVVTGPWGRAVHDDNRVRDDCFDFVQRCQCVAGDWRRRDFVAKVTSVWLCLQDIPESRTPAERLVLASAVSRMAVEVFRRTENVARTGRNTGPRARVESLLALLRLEHGKRGVGLKTLAVRVGINHCRLSRLLAAETRQPFHVHLGGWRVLSAVVLLGSETASIKEVAYTAGYAGSAELDRQFRAWLGMTPTQFRVALFHAPAVVRAQSIVSSRQYRRHQQMLQSPRR
jgi:AraC-like DNA-binding protein